MSRHTRAIVVKYKVQITQKNIVDQLAKWSGEDVSCQNGWRAVGWSWPVRKEGVTLLATAVMKNPPLNEDMELEDHVANAKETLQKLVFIIDEDPFSSSGCANYRYCSFAKNRTTLQQFMTDMGITASIQSPAVVSQTL
jgi:hypothetical protein